MKRFSRISRAQQYGKAKETGMSSGVGSFTTHRKFFQEENPLDVALRTLFVKSFQWMSTGNAEEPRNFHIYRPGSLDNSESIVYSCVHFCVNPNILREESV